jgi:maltose-binding protein MalE
MANVLKKLVILSIIVMLVAIGFSAMTMNVSAGNVDKITPSKGKAGRSVVIHGSGFGGGGVQVNFGDNPADKIEVKNDKNVKVTVPLKDVTDPDPIVFVYVWINGIPVPGEHTFEYVDKGQPLK